MCATATRCCAPPITSPRAVQGRARGSPAAFVAVDIHAALNALGDDHRRDRGEDLLDVIFREFCIGK